MLIFLILNHFLWANDSLEGRWQQGCQTQAIREEAFTGSDVTLSEFYYGNPTCTQGLMTLKSSGTFATGTTETNNTLDFTFTKITLTVEADVMAQDFNSRGVCDFSDWQIGVEKEITGLSCALITGGKPLKITSAGEKRFGIYKIDGGLLYFGRLEKDHDALSPEKRPLNFDPRYYVKRP